MCRQAGSLPSRCRAVGSRHRRDGGIGSDSPEGRADGGRKTMFEQIFDEYRKAVESSFEVQREMYRRWMNGLPVKPPEAAAGGAASELKEQIHSYRKEWSRTLAETMEQHREALNEQYKQ